MASAWPKAGGTMGALMRAYDWTRTPLGPPEAWPASLRSVVSLLLESKFPMFVAWGPELRFLYNDAYAEMLGSKHPAALAARFEDVWAEAWPFVRRLVEAAQRRDASWREDLPLVVNRYGYDEEICLTFSYSPVEDDQGEVAGVFCAVVETTERVRDQRARALLVELDDRLRDLADADAILNLSARMLGEHLAADRTHWVAVDAPADRFEVRQEWTRPGTPGLLGQHRLSGFGEAHVREMNAGGLIAIDDAYDHAPADPAQMEPVFGGHLRGALAVPLLRNGAWRAALCVHTTAPRRWRQDERDLVRDVAERVWTRAERAAAEARVRESARRFRALVNASPNVLFGMNGDWTEVRQLDGQGLRSQAVNERWMERRIPPEEQPRVQAAVREAIDSKAPIEMEHRVLRRDGTTGWALSRAIPVFDARGELLEWFGASYDVTEARTARQALEHTAERLELATEAAEVGFWDFDSANNVLFWPPRVKQMFGISADRPISIDDFYAGLHPDDHGRVVAAFEAAMDPARRALYDVEYRTLGKEDGRLRWVAAKGRALFDRQGACVRVIGTAIDITVRKASEEHLRLMVNELNHRVKNSLATVQAIAAQTLRRGETPDAVREALTSRLVALARAHDVLTDEKWSGAELTDLAIQAAAPYVGVSGESPFYIDGPSVFLPPKTAIAMALAFHELATNAAKYGALSAPGGQVLVAWSVGSVPGGRSLRLTWRETGGPPVQPPQRTGFGARLIQHGLASELQGRVSLDFQPGGLVCSVEARLPDEPVGGWTVDLQLS